MEMESCVPPGFRFHPTEEELVGYYLNRKISSLKIDLDVIVDIDLYKMEPWDIQETCKLGYEEQTEWYFFSHKDRKYPTGTRTNRATAAGFWKATGRDKAVMSSKNKQLVIGMRKTLVFYRGRAPNGRKTDWIMHEYRLYSSTNSQNAPPQEEGWVVCRAFKKPIPNQRQSFDHYQWNLHHHQGYNALNSPYDYHHHYRDQSSLNSSLEATSSSSTSSHHMQPQDHQIHQDQLIIYPSSQPSMNATNNGMTVIHHQDHQLPQLLDSPSVVVSTSPGSAIVTDHRRRSGDLKSDEFEEGFLASREVDIKNSSSSQIFASLSMFMLDSESGGSVEAGDDGSQFLDCFPDA